MSGKTSSVQRTGVRVCLHQWGWTKFSILRFFNEFASHAAMRRWRVQRNGCKPHSRFQLFFITTSVKSVPRTRWGAFLLLDDMACRTRRHE